MHTINPPQTHGPADLAQPGSGPSAPAPFPTHVLPQQLCRFVEEVAAALPCPTDFVAVPMLAILGAAIGNTRAIAVKPGYEERARIYAAVVGDTGARKSPALKQALRPLEERQHELFAAQPCRPAEETP